MKDTLGRILVSVLGAMIGIALGFIVVSFHMPYLESIKYFVIANGAVLGVLIAIVLSEHNERRQMAVHNTVRAETISLITHEMRTGLTSTGWAIGLVIKKYGSALEAKDKQMLEGISNSIHAIIENSINLLDISLIDIKKLSILLEIVPLETLEKMFNETLTKYALGAERNGITFTTSVKLDHKRSIEADLVRLRITLENLITNAFQYTVGERKEITVTIENDARYLCMKISDSGIGIPESEHERIFSEFYRASNAREKLVNGTGIGLYLSQQYVHAHHGEICFESKENEGTTFFISIPLKIGVDVHDFASKI